MRDTTMIDGCIGSHVPKHPAVGDTAPVLFQKLRVDDVQHTVFQVGDAPLRFARPFVVESFEGESKGMLQVLWGRGWIDDINVGKHSVMRITPSPL
jgi:hypothetical protein